jgi:hypothetical protein
MNSQPLNTTPSLWAKRLRTIDLLAELGRRQKEIADVSSVSQAGNTTAATPPNNDVEQQINCKPEPEMEQQMG